MIFQILTDSTADLATQWLTEHQVDVLGLTVQLDGVHYETVGPDQLTSPVLLEKMAAGSQPTTSQINVGQFEAYFTEKAQSGIAVLYVAFSSALSGTYQSAVMARDMVLDDYPGATITIVDTLAASAGEGYLVMEAARLRDAGLSLEETCDKIADLASRLKTHFLVDDLNHLMRGGRISKASAFIGGLVNIKPIISIQRDGKLESVAKVRGRKKAMTEFIQLALQDIAEPVAIVAYADDIETAESIKERLLTEPSIEEVHLFPLGPIIAAHVGPGTQAIFTIGKQMR
ncbi:DegV family protein [Streptococcus moroccensis]|uniref:DegV family protein with EDD domain n=1 Tax=Streptococcus moroccensis TaxID=1451356 RepID=A0ABT9YR08_9STRE|nr:DegV family protein [Streptococcus moroccensis]MDQ0222429.1 DegV family protein with EDD domain [Streptococcus moroccensis]